MQLIIGLGNPGKAYCLNRHNAGFLALDSIAQRFNTHFIESKKFKANLANLKIYDRDVILLKPNKFMNLSGESVWIIKNYYKIQLENIFVLHDDLDLAFAKVKIKQGGSSGGHNGLKSLDANISNNYFRLRIGIGRPPLEQNVADYVLSDFTNQEFNELKKLLDYICDNFQLLLDKSFSTFLNGKAN